MQCQEGAETPALGIPGETHWILPSGLGSQDSQTRAMPKAIGEVSRIQFPLRPGLEVYAHTGTIRSPVTMSYEVLTGAPYLWLAINLAGPSEYAHGTRLNGPSPSGTSHFAMLRDPKTVFAYAPEQQRAAGLLLDQARLHDMLRGQRLCGRVDDFIAGRFDPWVVAARPTPTLVSIANQVCNHPYRGAMAAIFLEAKAFELLAETLSVFVEDSQPAGLDRGRRYALAARDLIMADLAHPPRIEEVAQQVGLSQRRLNEVFRQTFGASPLQCLVQWRLDQARKLLAADGVAVKQVAYAMGYAHVSNFTIAFTRRFGHPPTRTPDRAHRNGRRPA